MASPAEMNVDFVDIVDAKTYIIFCALFFNKAACSPLSRCRYLFLTLHLACRSLLKAEGDHLLSSLSKLGTHTTHGVCRAVNVTGNAAAVLAGGVFKVAGAAILDGVGETAQQKSLAKYALLPVEGSVPLLFWLMIAPPQLVHELLFI